MLEIFNNTVFNISRNICCGYLIESPRRSDSNNYTQHMFLGVNKGIESFLSFIILEHVGILYSGKIVLTAESWGTNDVVITRFLCSKYCFCCSSNRSNKSSSGGNGS